MIIKTSRHLFDHGFDELLLKIGDAVFGVGTPSISSPRTLTISLSFQGETTPLHRNSRLHNTHRRRVRGKRVERRAQDYHIPSHLLYIPRLCCDRTRSHEHSIEKISYKFPTRFLQNCRRLDKAKIGNADSQVIAAAIKIYPASPHANRISQSPVSVVIYCGNHVRPRNPP